HFVRHAAGRAHRWRFYRDIFRRANVRPALEARRRRSTRTSLSIVLFDAGVLCGALGLWHSSGLAQSRWRGGDLAEYRARRRVGLSLRLGLVFRKAKANPDSAFSPRGVWRADLSGRVALGAERRLSR